MHKIQLSLFHRTAWIVLFFICAIVVTGALVRLTGSGLGCSDWPACNSSNFVDVSTTHSRIEQINRLFTGVVGVSVVVVILGAFRLSESRKDLRWLAGGLVLGVLAQIVLGGVVVLTGLNPFANMGHFALSMFLVGCAVALVTQSQPKVGIETSSVLQDVIARKLTSVFTGVLALALVGGMVVTGAGPHAGDEDAVRFGIAISTAARIHSVLVWLAVFTFLMLVIRVRNTDQLNAVNEGHFRNIFTVMVAQGAVGYWQYFTGVPVGLVAVHVGLATLLWALAFGFWLESRC